VRLQTIGMKVGGIVLLAAAVASGSVSARRGAAIEIGVTGRANGTAAIATSGAFVDVAWAGRIKDGVTDIYAATSRNGGRSFDFSRSRIGSDRVGSGPIGSDQV
jgi:hypothetical protein